MTATSKDIEAMIRVNHAGEYGATRIYAGQLAALKQTQNVETLEEMAQQEQKHLDYFNTLIIERQIRPTIFQPLWHVGGFALGYLTGILGEKVAHACTIAVEEVIEDHYQNQLNRLNDSEQDLKNIILECQADEVAHKEEAKKQGGEEAPFYPLLSTAIKHLSKAAIWLSERL